MKMIYQIIEVQFFTENRLKKYIELRSMDTCGWDCLCAGPAFYTGMFIWKS